MSDPKPNKPSHPPRLELHFHIPRFPHMSRAGWSSLATECIGLAMLHLASYGIDRVELYGDGIKVFVVVPNDSNIKLHFFDGHQEEIQRQIIVRAEARAMGKSESAQDALDRLTAFVVDYVDRPHGSLDTNKQLVDSVIGLLAGGELDRHGGTRA